MSIKDEEKFKNEMFTHASHFAYIYYLCVVIVGLCFGKDFPAAKITLSTPDYVVLSCFIIFSFRSVPEKIRTILNVPKGKLEIITWYTLYIGGCYFTFAIIYLVLSYTLNGLIIILVLLGIISYVNYMKTYKRKLINRYTVSAFILNILYWSYQVAKFKN